jgi:ribA/ribD-fused uncharacterized protein
MFNKIEDFSGGYDFLSNFYGCKFTYLGKEWNSSEHAYQAMKSKDPDEREKIRLAATPGKAKRLGRKVLHLDPMWDTIKGQIMYRILKQKFGQNPDLARKLLNTGDCWLIEGNSWHDNIWGNCTCSECEIDPGTNWLGEILMQLRNDFKEGNHE